MKSRVHSVIRSLYRIAKVARREWEYAGRPGLDSLTHQLACRINTIEDLPSPADPTRALYDRLSSEAICNYRNQEAEEVDELYRAGPTWQDVYRHSLWLAPGTRVPDDSIASALHCGFRNDFLEGDGLWSVRDRLFTNNHDLRRLTLTLLKSHEFVNRVCPEGMLRFPLSTVAQPIFLEHYGAKLNAAHMLSIYELHRLVTLFSFDPESPFVYCELGSGRGMMAHAVKWFFPRPTVILVDLPKTLLGASYFLSMNHPDARIAWSDDEGEVPLDAAALREYDMVFLPNYRIGRLQDATVDLFWNARSLSEMTTQSVANYIRNIERVTSPGGFFYSVNRSTERANRGDTDIPLDSFPIDWSKWQVLSRTREHEAIDVFFGGSVRNGEMALRRELTS